MTRTCCAIAALAVAATLHLSAQAASRRADRIFVNGKIWTADESRPLAQALAVRGDGLMAVGSDAEVKALAGPETVVVDLAGRLVVPGFQDSHLHFPGRSINAIGLDGLRDARGISARARGVREGALVSVVDHRTDGWGYSAFPNQTVDKKYIDAVISDRPVYVTERDGHMGLANAKALEIAGIGRGHAGSAERPHHARTRTGEPTGELKEAAQRLVRPAHPAPSAEESMSALLEHMAEAAAAGITAVQNASWSLDVFPVYLRAPAAGALKMRFRFAPHASPARAWRPKDSTAHEGH